MERFVGAACSRDSARKTEAAAASRSHGSNKRHWRRGPLHRAIAHLWLLSPGAYSRHIRPVAAMKPHSRASIRRPQAIRARDVMLQTSRDWHARYIQQVVIYLNLSISGPLGVALSPSLSLSWST